MQKLMWYYLYRGHLMVECYLRVFIFGGDTMSKKDFLVSTLLFIIILLIVLLFVVIIILI